MSKKILFMGGAVLFLVIFPALIGCQNRIDAYPLDLVNVEKVVLGTDTLTVTFGATLDEIDRLVAKTNYATTISNYVVTKNKAAALRLSGAAANKGADDRTVKITIIGIHSNGLAAGDTLDVELKGVGKGFYSVRPLQALRIGAINEAAKVSVVFNQELYSSSGKKAAIGEDWKTLFTANDNSGGGAVAWTAARVESADTILFELTG
ncbi:MAG: hypothetical protein LBP71_07150, partial [Spirochaetaceae bacterium]|nr:hypothetical protein [Spirochaetaceae bacterium]